MWTEMSIVTGAGLALALIALGIALRKPRVPAARPALWVIALVLLSIDVLLHAVVSIGSLLASPDEGGWMAIATVAIAAVLFAAARQPRLAGFVLIALAAIMPLLLVLVDLVVPVDLQSVVPLPVMLVAYSSRAVVVGVLLVLSTPSSKEAGGRSHAIAAATTSRASS